MNKWQQSVLIAVLTLTAGLAVGRQIVSASWYANSMPAEVPGGHAAAVTPSSQVIAPSTPPLINIVFPQDGQGHSTSVAQSRAVNVSAWYPQAMNCNLPDPALTLYYLDLRLYMAKNNEPLELVNSPPKFISRRMNGVSFPSAEFNNVPANLAQDPTSKYSFVLAFFDGFAPDSVWVHAADARTIYPQPVVPSGVTKVTQHGPWELDSRIQVVWPHDAQGNYVPPESATLVNVAVDLFKHGTLESVPVDYPPPDLQRYITGPGLVIAEANKHPFAFGSLVPDNLYSGRAPQKLSYTVNGQTFPRWVFNDVPVQPGMQYHFMVLIGGGSRPPAVRTYPTVWTHAADARTNVPNPQVPPPCVP